MMSSAKLFMQTTGQLYASYMPWTGHIGFNEVSTVQKVIEVIDFDSYKLEFDWFSLAF